jgi:hypothetical protein
MPEHPTENKKTTKSGVTAFRIFSSIIGLGQYNGIAAGKYDRATEGNPWSE